MRMLEGAVYLQEQAGGFPTPAFMWDTYYWYVRDFDAAGQNFFLHPKQDRFPNPQFKELYRAARTEMDQEKRGSLIKQMARLMNDEAPVLFLVWDQFPVVSNKKVATLPLPHDRSFVMWRTEKLA
jgi:ABC-type transport system substrate-binding protein